MNVLVLSGAATGIMVQAGMLHTALAKGLLGEIRAVYAVSAGSVLGCLLAFRVPIDDILAYMISRPWEKWFRFGNTELGAADHKLLRDLVRPLFLAHGIPLTLTMGQARERFSVDLHIFATEVREFESVDLSKFPDLPVLDAVCMSAAIYPLFSPVPFQDTLYIDGGYSCNFPITACLAHHAPSDVFAVNVGSEPTTRPLQAMDAVETATLIGYQIIMKLTNYKETHAAAASCKHYYCFHQSGVLSPDTWISRITSSEERERLIEHGKTLIA